MTDSELLERLWQSYAGITPQAEAIHALLRARGDEVHNDHIALRTFSSSPVSLDAMAQPFLALGWEPRDDYQFEDKQLDARYFARSGAPKVFISELRLGSLPARQRTIVDGLLRQLPPDFTADEGWIASGRPWSVTRTEYESLASVSEYAAWVAVHGFRANHFTVDVDRLSSVADLAELVSVLEEAGYSLNRSGGVIKGGPEVYLAQASTRADQIAVDLADGAHTVPSCYVEFAQRYPLPGGERYQGFVPTSADRIFESTDRQG